MPVRFTRNVVSGCGCMADEDREDKMRKLKMAQSDMRQFTGATWPPPRATAR